ncbi:hypothetical protein, conserved [Eimeria tenella]|uniref:Laminin EGF-like domain-containing protein n=1 Tax=Eimeria tenella TaxID=5802 RepID=U6L2Y5_EIMTE|nr:hypothetical protein, conserved [Eimeria tenella]CDJ44521.1 hypothetical protein, conserved [Eimeria tenella]|eukprot:XP_013235269.1 hypothetical protein, conserved [Eimeria tenella]
MQQFWGLERIRAAAGNLVGCTYTSKTQVEAAAANADATYKQQQQQQKKQRQEKMEQQQQQQNMQPQQQQQQQQFLLQGLRSHCVRPPARALLLRLLQPLLLLLLLLPLLPAAAAAANQVCAAGSFFDGAACVKCPEDTFGPSEGMTQCVGTFTNLSKGWWRAVGASWPAVYERCAHLTACTGPCGECMQGHEGPLCQMCSEGFTRDLLSLSSECRKCPAGWQIALKAIGLFLGFIIVVYLVSMALDFEAEQRLRVVTDRIRFTPALKQLLAYLAFWSSYGLSSRAVGPGGPLLEGKINSSSSKVEIFHVPSDWYLRYRNFSRKIVSFFVSVSSSSSSRSSGSSSSGSRSSDGRRGGREGSRGGECCVRCSSNSSSSNSSGSNSQIKQAATPAAAAAAAALYHAPLS